VLLTVDGSAQYHSTLHRSERSSHPRASGAPLSFSVCFILTALATAGMYMAKNGRSEHCAAEPLVGREASMSMMGHLDGGKMPRCPATFGRRQEYLGVTRWQPTALSNQTVPKAITSVATRRTGTGFPQRNRLSQIPGSRWMLAGTGSHSQRRCT
jgi:hypothetical protein